MPNAQKEPEGDDELGEGEGEGGLDLARIANELGTGLDGVVDADAIAGGTELAATEAFVEERVQRALAPYRSMFPPEVIAGFEDYLRCYLLTHPVASKMLARIRPRAQRSSSGEGVIMDRDPASGGALQARKNGAG
jgi:hypothetical protein